MAVTAEQLNEMKREAFEEKLVGVLNNGALALMTSIGHRTGLFDAMSKLPAASSAEVAAAAGLNERYVREWLGAMTAGGVVEHDPERGTYTLPPEHAALVTREGGSDNIGVFAQYIGQLGAVEDDIVECFHKGGGVPYERYQRFHEIMAEDSGQSVLPALKDHILPLVPGLTQRLEQGISVLDVGCGRGKAVNLMASRFPNSRFVGIDLSEEAIAYARREADEKRNSNVQFIARDLSDFDRTAEPGAFDFVTTFDAVHDQKDPKAVLKGIRTSLADDGVYLAQDIKGTSHHHGDRDHPIGPLLYTISCMHCMTVSLAQEGEGLGAMWGKEKALAYFREAGFSDVQVHELEHDFQNYYYACRP
ncbi:MAG: class I SAM-dependent methyltransferase [Gammaproteobacteria bacterium]|nr:class I SAM-dependent methyltransferase [Gammaproteobacteria bacterium]NIR82844.1 class I SAM-dependent methyltransferase [Gammaproteobacteria bacterium]NIR89953.1 class I SAM-dependent methyltransferase [Gammaproteobacteria bacterium]NIU04002.1 class I SAM-dependent methyltransferase [Gammaproteobacteria bacterium]NIV51322.1 methyltransferase domain-containing protein [Gammaproteobacteria bacterium]